MGFAEVAWEVAKPPRAADLMCVAALSLGLNWTFILDASHLDVLFWTFLILDILTPENFRLTILTHFDLRLFTFST